MRGPLASVEPCIAPGPLASLRCLSREGSGVSRHSCAQRAGGAADV